MNGTEKQIADQLLTNISRYTGEERSKAILDYRNFMEAVQIRVSLLK